MNFLANSFLELSSDAWVTLAATPAPISQASREHNILPPLFQTVERIVSQPVTIKLLIVYDNTGSIQNQKRERWVGGFQERINNMS